tara:strand:+ start:5962 stop:6498 length:537 start_codon:yes stop_codon:yes gene_type:complete
MMKLNIVKHVVIVLVSVVMTAGLSGYAEAWEFRQFSPIGPPELYGPPGAVFAESLNLNLKLEPIPPGEIKKAVRDFFSAWNSGSIDTLLAPSFVNAERLLDTIESTVPRNAQIRVQSIQSTATLPGDLIEELPDGQGFDRIVRVTATVQTQIEFTDSNGFQKINGVSDYTFQVREEYR